MPGRGMAGHVGQGFLCNRVGSGRQDFAGGGDATVFECTGDAGALFEIGGKQFQRIHQT
jgi:hypothetical protein